MSDDDELQRRALARVGSVLRGKYRLDGVLGLGGMAVVYAATHRNQAEFAVKVLHPELSLSKDLRTRFLREGYSANSVKHPGAVLVVDDDVAEDGAAFLVMERLYGGSVEDLLAARGVFPSRLAALVTLRLLEVIIAAHDKGIVHRDIKPANVFVTREGQVKVLDFGIARARDALQANGTGTGTGVVLGTPAYMAPEQAMARGDEIDERTDLWAIGATLYTMLTGELVHAGDNAHQLLVSAATQPARPINGAGPRTEETLAFVVDKALQFRREDRFQNAASMRDAIASRAMVITGGAASVADLAAFAQGDVHANGLSESRTLPASDAMPTPRWSEPLIVAGEASEPIAVAVTGRPSFEPAIAGGGVMGGHGTQSSLSTLIEPPRPRPPADRRKRLLIKALAAVPIVILGALGLSMTVRSRAPRETAEGQRLEALSLPGAAMADGAPASSLASPLAPSLALEPTTAADDSGALALSPSPVPSPPVTSPPPLPPSAKLPGAGGARTAHPPARPKVDCSVKYEYVNGIKQFKEQCL